MNWPQGSGCPLQLLRLRPMPAFLRLSWLCSGKVSPHGLPQAILATMPGHATPEYQGTCYDLVTIIEAIIMCMI